MASILPFGGRAVEAEVQVQACSELILDLNPGNTMEQLCDLGKCLNSSHPGLLSFEVQQRLSQ